ncbi:MAG: PIG-L family deacetylase [Actinomycetota bacterium]|nr:PIG-L family deacetylase [Actinomycetota bacterium]
MATVAFLHAHPDDEALATGGTMARLVDEGHRVVLIAATRGEEGEPVPGVLDDDEALGERRTAELHAAAGILGVHRLAFLGYRDSGMADDPANDHPDCFWQADVAAAAERLGGLLDGEDPDLLVVYDPSGGYGHPDHIQVHRVGVRWASVTAGVPVRWVTMNRDAIRAAIDRAVDELASGEATWANEEMLELRRQRTEVDTFGMADDEITHAVDVTAVIDRKRDAIRAHASQVAADSFFLSMPDEAFAATFGTEWFVDPGRPRNGRVQSDDLLLA